MKKPKRYEYKNKFTIMQDHKGITVIEFDGPLCRKIDAFQIPVKGTEVIGRAGIVIEGDETWQEFAKAINAAFNIFQEE